MPYVMEALEQCPDGEVPEAALTARLNPKVRPAPKYRPVPVNVAMSVWYGVSWVPVRASRAS